MAAVAPLLAGVPPGVRANGELCAGDQVLLRYADPEALWHVRILLALVTGEWWIVLTPTGDLYSEQISNANRDLLAWRFRGGAGGVPFGILPGQIFDFAPAPSPAQLQQLIAEGEQLARQERVRLGLPAAAAAPPPAGVGVAAAFGDAAIALPPLGAPPPVGGAGLCGGAAALAHAAGLAVGGLAPAGGAHFGAGYPPPGGALPPFAGLPLGGAAAGFGGAAAASAVFGGIPGVHDIGAGAFSQDAGISGDDARTLAIIRDNEGVRFSEFREATKKSRPTDFPDWPIAGPRTTKWALDFISEHGGTPLGHHQAWRSACRFQPGDGPVLEHESWSRVLQSMVCYDQLDATNLACGELVARNIQRIEERHKDRAIASEEQSEAALFMGMPQGSRAGLCISPALNTWAGKQTAEEACVAKERRKAREERALARKPAKKGGGKAEGD